MGDWIDFAEVRSGVSLEEVLLRMYGLGDRLKRQGKKLIGPCVIHGGDSPRAFQADLEKNVWFCFSGCRRGGNAIDFVAAVDGISIREAALKLHAAYLSDRQAPASSAKSAPSAASPRPPTPATSSTARAPPSATVASAEAPDDTAEADEGTNLPLALRPSLAHDHPHLLKERGLSPETVQRFGVGYCARGLLRGTIAIPIHDEDGELVAYAGRRLKGADIREHGKYRFPAKFRKDLVLYHLDRAKPFGSADGLVLVEGFFAVMALFERGVPNAVASMGCSLSKAQAGLLAEHAGHVTILFDGDAAGRGGADESLALLDERRIAASVVRLPDGWKPEHAPARLLRWAANGVRLLGLRELAFTPAAERGAG